MIKAPLCFLNLIWVVCGWRIARWCRYPGWGSLSRCQPEETNRENNYSHIFTTWNRLSLSLFATIALSLLLFLFAYPNIKVLKMIDFCKTHLAFPYYYNATQDKTTQNTCTRALLPLLYLTSCLLTWHVGVKSFVHAQKLMPQRFTQVYIHI